MSSDVQITKTEENRFKAFDYACGCSCVHFVRVKQVKCQMNEF